MNRKTVRIGGTTSEHVLSHLANARGILQADGYKGYAKLYEPEPGGVPRLREAAC
jgi:transposase